MKRWMRGAAAGVLGVLLVATRAGAQEPGRASIDDARTSIKESISTALLRGLYVSTPIVHAVDGFSTLRVVELGGRELNPLLAAQVSNRPLFATTKMSIAAAEVLIAHRLAKRHKYQAILAMTAVNVTYAFVAAHNLRLVRMMSVEPIGHSGPQP